jgi:flagellar FliJ protein
MGFRFSLAQVLRLREGVEKREELALQTAEFEVARVQRRIDKLTTELAQTSKEREAALQMWMRAAQLKNFQDEMNASVEVRRNLLDTLAELKAKREIQMKLYQAARVERRMLSDLRKQKLSAWEQDQTRNEQKQLDDTFVARLQRS